MALLEAYQGTEVFGFEVPYELPERDEDGICGVFEELCEGLEWIKERGLRAREYTPRLFIHGSLSRCKIEAAALLSERDTKINLAPFDIDYDCSYMSTTLQSAPAIHFFPFFLYRFRFSSCSVPDCSTLTV